MAKKKAIELREESKPKYCCDKEFKCSTLPEHDDFACDEHTPRCDCSKTLPHNGYENHHFLKCGKNHWCWPLEERLAPECNAHMKGFSTLVLTNMKTGKHRCYGVSYKTKSTDNGLLIRFCPWCGVNLYDLFEVEKSPEERSDSDE